MRLAARRCIPAMPPAAPATAARLAQGEAEEMLAEVDPDQLAMPRLLLAQQVARPALIEVSGADCEACAEPVVRRQQAQPGQSARSEVRVPGGGEVDGAAPRAAKPTITSSIWAAASLPCASTIVSSGTSRASSARSGTMSAMRGTTTKLCPPRARSRSRAVRSLSRSMVSPTSTEGGLAS